MAECIHHDLLPLSLFGCPFRPPFVSHTDLTCTTRPRCNLHPAWNEAMCTVWSDSVGKARGREEHEGVRGVREPRSRRPIPHPPLRLSSRSPFPLSCRDQGYSLESRRQERKKKERVKRSRAEKESTADAESLPRSLLNPDPEFAATSLTLSLGCGSFAYGRGQNHPTGLRTLDLAGFRRLARTVHTCVASGDCPRVLVSSWVVQVAGAR